MLTTGETLNELKKIGVIEVSLRKMIFMPFEPTKIIKKTAYLLSVAVFLAFFGKPTYAGSEEQGLTAVSVLKFSAGVATSMLIHESAHALVAGVTDTPMTWKLGTYNQPLGFTENAESDAKGVALYSAGIISQAITAEVILQTDKADKNDAFLRGLMTWNILNPVLYSLDYWIFHVSNKKNGNSYQGDISGIEHYSNNATANGYAISMTAIAFYQGYRFLQTQSWAPDWLKTEKNKLILAPLPSGGFVAAYQFSF
jgi:hypothetical protein